MKASTNMAKNIVESPGEEIYNFVQQIKRNAILILAGLFVLGIVLVRLL